MLKPKLLKMFWRVRIKSGNRDAKQSDCEKYDAVIVIFEQDESVPTHPLAKGHWTACGRSDVWQQKCERRENKPGERGGVTSFWGGIDIYGADEPAAAHPAEGCN